MPMLTTEVTVTEEVEITKEVTINFEVWCDTCGRGICDHVVKTEDGHIYIKPCKHCLQERYDAGFLHGQGLDE